MTLYILLDTRRCVDLIESEKCGLKKLMATPLTGIGHLREGGGVAIMAGPVDPPPPTSSSSSTKACVKNSAQKSPILIFLFFHKAIKSELESLHRAAMDFATNQQSDIKPLLKRYHFLRSIYKHHCNAEDEVGYQFCCALRVE